MAIKYYPNRVFKGKVPAIDRQIAKRRTITTRGSQDISGAVLDQIITTDSGDGWQIDSIGFDFNSAAARDYSASVINGRKVVVDLNDYLWFQLPTTLPEQIILDPGFYTGTQLAAELKIQLDANAAFSAAGITFTVTYTDATGLFAISPSSGTLRFLNINTTQTLRTRDTIAGHLIGLNVDTDFVATVTSDTAVFGLNTQTSIIDESGSTVLNDFDDNIHTLSIDQGLRLESNSGPAVIIDFTVIHEDLV